MQLHKASALVVSAALVVGGAPARAEQSDPGTSPGERTEAARSPGGASVQEPGPRRGKPRRAESPKDTEARESRPEVPPLTSPGLEARARLLLEAVARGEPELADPFFFPKEPFLVLKDVADPGRYHQELVRVYHRNIQDLHARRRSWEGARFVSFELGSRPRWTAPGHEWNKLGYYRTFDARLIYELAGRRRTLVVRTIISWDGEWYVTHLSPVKH